LFIEETKKTLNKNISIIKTVGRRKSAIAQINIRVGRGEFVINGKPAFLYMQENPAFLVAMQSPLELLGIQKNFSIHVIVKGGGLAGQADAIKLGVARAICKIDQNSRDFLKKKGYLIRDSRIKERRKYGLKKARKAPQFSKR
jgi:small subunit ribosomal protein S9